jgi:carboxyl-terminal processing protease
MKIKWSNKWMVAVGIAATTIGLFGFKGDERNFQISKNLDIFNSAFKELDLFYVDTLDPEKVISTGLRAMLEQLDPYTVYYSEDQAEELKMMTTGKYAGIGSIIRFHKALNHVVIAEPYEHMPAAEVGLKAGDILLEIDGKDLTGKTTAAVSDLLRGEAGTSFLLKYQRPGQAKPTEVKIERKNIQTPAVPYYGMVDNGTGYIQLNSFTEDCSRDVRRAVIDLKQQGATSLVLDLRGNGGGLMNEAVEIVNLFVEKGVEVLSTKGKLKQANSVNRTTKEPLDTEIPLVVLVDGDSASASEIVAGSLQDLDRAVIIGARTYGKGLVQVIRELPYNGNMKVTTSKYYIPSGRCVQAINYSHRDASGRPERIPDSLTTVFHTKVGREVRDGGGVTPDVKVKQEKLPTLLYYLANSDELFDFATEFCQRHPQIASAQAFSISDEEYARFKEYMKQSKFTYDQESEKSLKALRDLAEMEGYLDGAQEEFKALEKKLTPQLDQDLEHFAKEIKQLLAGEIVQRYYYQRGAVIQQLKDDKDLKEAQRILSHPEEYKTLLAPKSEQPIASTEVKEKTTKAKK